MLTVIEKVIFLQNVDLFSQVPTEQLAYLAAVVEETTASKGEILYRESDPPDAMYLVVEGSIRLHRGDQEITVAERKDAFGTWALFDEEPRVVTATALEESRLLRIGKEEFIDMLADHVQITQGIIKTIAGKLRGLIDRIGVESTPGTNR
jgi:CRP-like cAMP-binding protein